jgi:hypothetical protein
VAPEPGITFTAGASQRPARDPPCVAEIRHGTGGSAVTVKAPFDGSGDVWRASPLSHETCTVV